MGLRGIINKILGRDFFYSNVKRSEKKDYQAYFLKILNLIDIDNLTKNVHSQPFNQELAEKDYSIIEKIANEAKNKDKLLPLILQIMVEQYIWADVWCREQDKNTWIYKVINRKETDYFPDTARVYQVLFKE